MSSEPQIVTSTTEGVAGNAGPQTQLSNDVRKVSDSVLKTVVELLAHTILVALLLSFIWLLKFEMRRLFGGSLIFFKDVLPIPADLIFDGTDLVILLEFGSISVWKLGKSLVRDK